MKEKRTKNQPPPKPKRPMGVWALTAYSFLSAGLLTTLVAVQSIITEDPNARLYDILFRLILGIAIILLSIGAWQGKETARKLYLVAISLHYVIILINDILILGSGVVLADASAALWQQIFLSVALLVTNWVYFNLRMVKAFYQSA